MSVAAIGWRVAPFGAVLTALPKDGVLNVLRADGLKSPALLVMTSPLLGSVTEAMLGGGLTRDARGSGGRKPLAPRPASGSSPVTQRLARRLGTLAMAELTQALGDLCPGGLRLTRQETEPVLAAIMSDDENALIAEVRVTVVGIAHVLSFVLPEAALSRSKLQKEVAATDRAQASPLARELVAASVELVALYGELTITTSKLLGLALGDVLPLTRRPEDPLDLLVEGLPKLQGVATVSRGNHALRITNKLPKTGAA